MTTTSRFTREQLAKAALAAEFDARTHPPQGSPAAQLFEWAAMLTQAAEMAEELERCHQAIGLATIVVPDMEIDVRDPVGMMQRVVTCVRAVEARLAQVRAWAYYRLLHEHLEFDPRLTDQFSEREIQIAKDMVVDAYAGARHNVLRILEGQDFPAETQPPALTVSWQMRAEAAEATIARVRAYVDEQIDSEQWTDYGCLSGPSPSSLRAILDGTEGT